MMTETLGDPQSSPDSPADLVVISLSGVQRFIAESRTTADLSAASAIVARLSATAANAAADSEGASVVFPVGRVDEDRPDGRHVPGTPNRVVVRVPPGNGEPVARLATDAVQRAWGEWVRRALETRGPEPTPGMPNLPWVVVPASVGDYATQWKLAQRALAARKRIRDFPERLQWEGRALCSLSPRWPTAAQPPKVPEHQADRLSAANWVKRRWRKVTRADPDEQVVGFASTSSIASAPYRREVLTRLDHPAVRQAAEALRRAWHPLRTVPETPVPGLHADTELGKWVANAAGVWVYPDSWHAERLRREFARIPEGSHEQVARQGRAAALALAGAMSDGAAPVGLPTNYLAVLAQDLDDLGKFLSGDKPAWSGASLDVTPAGHQAVSRRLGEVAREQGGRLASESMLGSPVYAGGDDLLAFLPAETALDAAQLCHDAVPDDLRTVSTAVLFFHRTTSLRHALAEVRRLLQGAKSTSPKKHALAVGFLRRSGAAERSIQPWSPPPGTDPRGAVALFETFVRRGGQDIISPRLVTALERDAAELSNLPDPWYGAELARLVTRHGGDQKDAEALRQLGYRESGATGPTPAPAARVAVFLRQECRPFRPSPTGEVS